MITDKIHELPIHDVVSNYVADLKKVGVTYKACCPIHNEKTPSFTLYPKSNTFKCFGCGAGGDAISFVMKYKNVEFIEACRLIANDHNITIDFKTEPITDPTTHQRKEKLYGIMQWAQQYFVSQLNDNEVGKAAMEYIRARFSDEVIENWSIGYAIESWESLLKESEKTGYTQEDLISIGLLSESKGKVFDTYRNRIIFPISDYMGRIVAFSGRILPGDETTDEKKIQKYINTKTTEIYTKGNHFYGITTAINEIRKTETAYLVEGNTDVIRLQEVGPINTIAPLGTSITKEQVDFLSKYCKSVIIIGDSDNAGQKAINANAAKLISSGLFVNVIELPKSENKTDPDSFFGNPDIDFFEYSKDAKQDFIVWTCLKNAEGAKSPEAKQKVLSEVSELISKYPQSTQELYIEQVSSIIKPKKAWSDQLKEINSSNSQKEKTNDQELIPADVNANDFEKFGFFEKNNQYFFRTNKGIIARGANFVMKPLFHVQSVIEAKRLFQITNEYGYSQIIELQQKDLISLQNFRLRVESLGNFLWEASESELNKLKRYLYEKTETCTEIKQLGWQKQGFWAWGNGIFNGSFTKSNEYGIVKHSEVNYYIPAFSKIYEHEDTLFISERKFIHSPGEITMIDLIQKMENVFGKNAQISYAFFLATCFRDFIVARFGFFPILNMFGPKGTGKTEMALSMLYFFGKGNRGPNINNTSKAALADHISQHSNALCHIDEYKNNIEFEKIEFLKGIWDGTGRTKMNMEKDRKKETTNVDIGLILTGQEMPTTDIALFSRLIFITFYKTEYTDSEKAIFNELKDILNKGITHLTHQVLMNREHFTENYFNNYAAVCSELNDILGEAVIEDRIFRNWAIIGAAFITLNTKIQTHINESDIMQLIADSILSQNNETKRTNDVANFWDIFSYLVKENELVQEVDFKIIDKKELKLINRKIEFPDPKDIIYLNHTRVFQKYRKHGANTRDSILPVKTLEYYLMNSKEYFGKMASCEFKMLENIEDVNDKKRLRQITTAHTFDYDLLKNNYGISVTTNEVNDDSGDGSQNSSDKVVENSTQLILIDDKDLPF